ncbi:MAG: hypothetical protein KUG81_08530 [Gammaproteobacteria bacterium]|nr:hypothetical protein [Gammaproteobacteria bacterium]
MNLTTEIFIFKTDADKRDSTIDVLKDLQKEIIEASNGSVISVRTLVGSSDSVTISQIYEWDDLDSAKRVNELFFGFNSAAELQVLNKENIFMGQLLEIENNNYSK